MKRHRRRFAAIISTALVLAASRCASAPHPSPSREQFPLDPREEIDGAFDEAVGEGWRALATGDAERAEREFGRADGKPSRRAAEIGTIEALVLGDRPIDALGRCADALADGEPTVPLLTACGEARARVGEPVEAHELYQRAVSRAPSRPAIARRGEELRELATESLLAGAEDAASGGQLQEARARVARALAWNPGSAQVLARAAIVECAAGEKERALKYYREALALGDLDFATRERAGELALEVGDFSMAVSIFDSLAASDPRLLDRAAEARLAFRIANWPDPERQAARARRLTRAGAASLVWWMFPEVREAKVRAGIVASDVLERKDSRAMMRAISLGLLDVDADTHRARPDGPLSRGVAAQLMLRLAGTMREGSQIVCLQGSPGPWRGASDAIRLVSRCGLLSESGGPVVGGREFTRGLDRLRSLLSSGEVANRD